MTITAETLASWWDLVSPYTDQIRDALPQALVDLVGDRTDIVGVGLMTDSDGGTLAPVALTAEHLAQMSASNPDFALFYAWCPNEWDLVHGAPFDPLMRDLDRALPEIPDSQWGAFARYLFSVYEQILLDVADAGFFDARFPGANIAFWVTDNDEPVEVLVNWVEDLNPPERTAPYVAWLRANAS